MAAIYPDAVAVYDQPTGQWASLAPQSDIASQGDTAAEAIANVLEAVREVEEFCREAGYPMPGPVSWADFGEFVQAGSGSMVVSLSVT
jgi:predicted RNase H-like HicB family nuclease